MRFTRSILLISSILILFFSCSKPGAIKSDKILVATSILPLADFVNEVGGEHVEVFHLVPPGASPHTYELTPLQLRNVAKAHLLVLNGVGMEFWADKLIQSMDSEKLKVVDTSTGIEILDAEEDDHHGHAHDHAHDSGNPHIWLDPVNVIQQITHIKDALIEVDSANRESYEQNAADYIQQLNELHREILTEIETWQYRKFICFHPAWVYFAERYGLYQAAVVQKTPGMEPSPQELVDLIKIIQNINAKAVFAEPQSSSKMAETIAEETNARVIYLDPLGSEKELNKYIELMRYNVNQMALALK